MKKFIYTALIVAIVLGTAFALIKVDKSTRQIADFLQYNTVFKIENGTITILNEEIRLK